MSGGVCGTADRRLCHHPERSFDGYITCPELLEQAKQEPQFKEPFDNDPAFRQGVLTAMDQATRERESFD